MSKRGFIVLGLVAAFFVAAVVSGFASSNPDGLERVAEDQGFSQSAGDHPAGEGPMADYSVDGVDNSRLSGGLAGVVGAAVVLLLMAGLVLLVRRRGSEADTSEVPTSDTEH
ncbi:MAG: PDGLE domain-containing protein [Nocardioides sp.]